jgi:hypothetical protein
MTEMTSMAQNAVIIVDARQARTTLPNGQNAHGTIKPADWWRERLGAYYPILEPIAMNHAGSARPSELGDTARRNARSSRQSRALFGFVLYRHCVEVDARCRDREPGLLLHTRPMPRALEVGDATDAALASHSGRWLKPSERAFP